MSALKLLRPSKAPECLVKCGCTPSMRSHYQLDALVQPSLLAATVVDANALGRQPDARTEFHQIHQKLDHREKRASRKEDMPPKAAECSVCRGFDHHRGRSVKFKLKHIYLWWDVLTRTRQKFHVNFQSAKKPTFNPLTQPRRAMKLGCLQKPGIAW